MRTSHVLCPRAIICPGLRAILHLRPRMGTQPARRSAGLIGINWELNAVGSTEESNSHVFRANQDQWQETGFSVPMASIGDLAIYAHRRRYVVSEKALAGAPPTRDANRPDRLLAV